MQGRRQDACTWRELAVDRRRARYVRFATGGGDRVDVGRGDEEARVGWLCLRVDERFRLRRAHRRRCEEGEDFGATTFPGTGDSFLAVVDVFAAATKAKNAKNALAFLGAISKPATQIAFKTSKGSFPTVRDVDVSALMPYQRGSSKALWTSPVLLSIAHGEARLGRRAIGRWQATRDVERWSGATQPTTPRATPGPRH